jgi:MOSC domain-containing protein YiiM
MTPKLYLQEEEPIFTSVNDTKCCCIQRERQREGGTIENVVGSTLAIYGRRLENGCVMTRFQVLDATVSPIQGMHHHNFWHMNETNNTDRIKAHRSILIQSIQAYRIIQREGFAWFPKTEEEILHDPRFGEQIILDISGDICLGDIFAIQGSTLKLRVTSPRKPCINVDKKNFSPYGSQGLRHFTLAKGLAGWFCEVLTEGHIQKGSVFELLERPHPHWTMEEIARATYGGEGDTRRGLQGRASWGRSLEVLEELLSIPYLADYEWKDNLKELYEDIRSREASATGSRLFQPLYYKLIVMLFPLFMAHLFLLCCSKN